MYGHNEFNSYHRPDATTPAVLVTITVVAEDGIDLHDVGRILAETARSAIDSVHTDAHRGDPPRPHHTENPERN